MPINIQILKRCELDNSKNEYLNSVSPIFRPIRYAIWMIRKNGTEKERAERKAVRELESAAARVRSAYKDYCMCTFTTAKRDTLNYYQTAYERAVDDFYLKFGTRIHFFDTDQISDKTDEIIKLAARLIYDPLQHEYNDDADKITLIHNIYDNICNSLKDRKIKHLELAHLKIDDLYEDTSNKKIAFDIFKLMHKDTITNKKTSAVEEFSRSIYNVLKQEIKAEKDTLDAQIAYVNKIKELNEIKARINLNKSLMVQNVNLVNATTKDATTKLELEISRRDLRADKNELISNVNTLKQEYDALHEKSTQYSNEVFALLNENYKLDDSMNRIESEIAQIKKNNPCAIAKLDMEDKDIAAKLAQHRDVLESKNFAPFEANQEKQEYVSKEEEEEEEEVEANEDDFEIPIDKHSSDQTNNDKNVNQVFNEHTTEVKENIVSNEHTTEEEENPVNTDENFNPQVTNWPTSNVKTPSVTQTQPTLVVIDDPSETVVIPQKATARTPGNSSIFNFGYLFNNSKKHARTTANKCTQKNQQETKKTAKEIPSTSDQNTLLNDDEEQSLQNNSKNKNLRLRSS